MTDEFDPIVTHYVQADDELNRLKQGASRIEFARTQELLRRFLPSAPCDVLDIGGGPGSYSAWLSELGYRAHLVDITPLHVEQARALAQQHGDAFTAEVGDARQLSAGDGSFDVALLLGPLYHLVEREDRLQALREAKRVVRPGGLVAAAGISRLASVMDGVRLGFILDPRFRAIVERDLADGQHRNPDQQPGWFTTAFFHRPADLQDELGDAGLHVVGIFGVEGPGWLRPELWDDPSNREALLSAARLIETDRDGVALSAHLLAIGRA
jgi:SAM-dependent methyltransferase